MKFKNNGETRKVRFPEEGGFFWKTIYSGEIVDLPKEVGKNYGFVEVKFEQPKEIKPVKKSKK